MFWWLFAFSLIFVDPGKKRCSDMGIQIHNKNKQVQSGQHQLRWIEGRCLDTVRAGIDPWQWKAAVTYPLLVALKYWHTCDVAKLYYRQVSGNDITPRPLMFLMSNANISIKVCFSSHVTFQEQALTLHVLELGIVWREEGENSLRFPVTVYVQLQVGQHGAETGDNKRVRRSFQERGTETATVLFV